MWVELDVADRYVTIAECRPPWRATFGPEWTRSPIATLRYVVRDRALVVVPGATATRNFTPTGKCPRKRPSRNCWRKSTATRPATSGSKRCASRRRRRPAARGRLSPIEVEALLNPTATQAAQPNPSTASCCRPGRPIGIPVPAPTGAPSRRDHHQRQAGLQHSGLRQYRRPRLVGVSPQRIMPPRAWVAGDAARPPVGQFHRVPKREAAVTTLCFDARFLVSLSLDLSSSRATSTQGASPLRIRTRERVSRFDRQGTEAPGAHINDGEPAIGSILVDTCTVGAFLR